jgi:hypothetical protein
MLSPIVKQLFLLNLSKPETMLLALLFSGFGLILLFFLTPVRIVGLNGPAKFSLE